MKKTYLTIIGATYSIFAICQNPVGNPPSNPNSTSQTAAQAWYRGGNLPVNGTPANANIFGTKWDETIWHQTNGINRLVMYNGGTANNAGRIATGNNLPNNFVPQARLHLYQTGGFNNLRFTTDATGHTAADGQVIATKKMVKTK
jgi:hypothetical protein